jgi:hypothetical protein
MPLSDSPAWLRFSDAHHPVCWAAGIVGGGTLRRLRARDRDHQDRRK